MSKGKDLCKVLEEFHDDFWKLGETKLAVKEKKSAAETHPFEVAVEMVLDHEGGYVNHPLDRGGPTNMGITLATLTNFNGVAATAKDVAGLTRSQAINIYRYLYWNGPKLDTLSRHPKLQIALFNQGVLRGPVNAIKTLQKVVGATPDGTLGRRTLEKLEAYGERQALRDFLQACQMAYADICVAKPSQIVFLRGWLNRTHELWDLLLGVG